MRNKLFKSIFLALIIALVSATVMMFTYFYSILSRVSGVDYNAWDLLGETFFPTLGLAFLFTLLAYFVASRMSAVLVKPINDLDPEHPEDTDTYDELKPIIQKLSSQNYKIARQMEMLKIRENEFNSITHNMSEGLVVINSRAAVLSCNKSAMEIFDVNEVPTSVLGINNSRSFRLAVAAAISGKNGYDSLRKGDKYYSIFATPVIHEGLVEGAVIVILDVTEKEQREGLRREFTSNVSHELKTPLAAISGFAEIIKSGISSEADTVRFAENIHKEAQRLISLVGDIIRLSRLDGGEIPYDDDPIDLLEVAREVKERLDPVAEGAKIKISVSGECAPVRGNYTIIEEMVYNLSDNAIKYNREGGFVRIDVAIVGGAPTVSVTDNGIGIPADKKDRVFERFYRVDKSRSRAIGGTGLGLSIVKHAAIYHKASIKIDSEENKGTTVTISFPHA